METDQGLQHVLPFQLQFDKLLATQVKMAERNPEKDLLAMVTEDSKVVLHHFNWQRLWTISPGELVEDIVGSRGGQTVGDSMHGFHCLVLDTSIFQKRLLASKTYLVSSGHHYQSCTSSALMP